MGKIRERSERLLDTYPGVSRWSLSEIYTPFNESMVKVSRCQTPGTSQIQISRCQRGSNSVKLLLPRLQFGSRWLTSQHEARLAGNAEGKNNERFSTCLESWELMERTLRNVYGYEGCIFGPGDTCPTASRTRCEACTGD